MFDFEDELHGEILLVTLLTVGLFKHETWFEVLVSSLNKTASRAVVLRKTMHVLQTMLHQVWISLDEHGIIQASIAA